jgi:hypothetical protein
MPDRDGETGQPKPRRAGQLNPYDPCDRPAGRGVVDTVDDGFERNHTVDTDGQPACPTGFYHAAPPDAGS